MTTLEILRGARALMAKRGGWTQDVLEDESGAVCAVGALSKVAIGKVGYGVTPECEDAEALLKDVVGECIVDYNDSHSKKCVLAAFSAAIAEAQKAQK